MVASIIHSSGQLESSTHPTQDDPFCGPVRMLLINDLVVTIKKKVSKDKDKTEQIQKKLL